MKVNTMLCPVDRADVIRNLYPLYLHDLSAMSGQLPNEYGVLEDGPVRTVADQGRQVDEWWEHPGVLFPHVVLAGLRPVGFGLVSSGRHAPDGVDWYMHDFFVVAPVRGTGAALTGACGILGAHPGGWAIDTEPANERATAFWRKVVQATAPGAWRETTGPAFFTDDDVITWRFEVLAPGRP